MSEKLTDKDFEDRIVGRNLEALRNWMTFDFLTIRADVVGYRRAVLRIVALNKTTRQLARWRLTAGESKVRLFLAYTIGAISLDTPGRGQPVYRSAWYKLDHRQKSYKGLPESSFLPQQDQPHLA